MRQKEHPGWDRYWREVDRLTDRALKAEKNRGKSRDSLQLAVMRWLEIRFAKGLGYPSQ